MGNADQ
ncbi:Protein of unknown function [Bacillus cytotoxicus]|nr:Protein of unknown function [Bacillus cytotoxicus]